MSSFTTDLILRVLPDGRRFELMEAFVYEVGQLGSGESVQVPKGFVTDFASIPQMFWNVLPPWGTYGKACIVHDYLYQGGVITFLDPTIPGITTHVDPTREQADNILREGMEALGVSWWKRNVIFRGVRIGGRGIWNKEHHPYEAR